MAACTCRLPSTMTVDSSSVGWIPQNGISGWFESSAQPNQRSTNSASKDVMPSMVHQPVPLTQPCLPPTRAVLRGPTPRRNPPEPTGADREFGAVPAGQYPGEVARRTPGLLQLALV